MLLLLACTGGEPVEGLVLTGWNYGWENLSHRVALLQVGLQDDSSLKLGFIGGPYSSGVAGDDIPLYRVRFSKVAAPDIWFVSGEAELIVDPSGKASTESMVDISALPEHSNVIALIRGFRIETDIEQGDDYPYDIYDPSYGYTTSGFGITLSDPVLSGGNATIPISAEVRWKVQDRDDMNAAIPYAYTRLIVEYTLVGFEGELQSQPLSNTTTYEVEDPTAPIWVYTEQPPVVVGAEFSGKPAGFVGWKSFDLGLNLTGDFSDTGDYVRALGLELLPVEDSQKLWQGQITSTIQTTSLIELTILTASLNAELVHIGVKDALVEHFVAEGSHPVGPAVTGPLLP
jgi:hypothetical protein